MAESDNSEDKDLPGSEQKIRKAREEGDLPRSRELSGGLVMLCAASALFFFSGSISTSAQNILSTAFTLDRPDAFDPSRMSVAFVDALMGAFYLMLPVLALSFLGAVAGSILVGGFNWSTKALSFNAGKLNPIKGLKNIFSINGLAELIKAILKTVVIGGLGFYLVTLDIASYSSISTMSLKEGIKVSAQLVAVNTLILVCVYFFISALDVPYQLWRHAKKMRMSFQEMKKENKETEGDPYLKARIKQIQREMSKRRMMASVPGADVIITNPTHYAVALSYRRGELSAPVVVAKGVDDIAARIREIAAEHFVPVVEAAPLARALYANVEINNQIPDLLFRAVAKVLAYVYALADGGDPSVSLPDENDVPFDLDPANKPH